MFHRKTINYVVVASFAAMTISANSIGQNNLQFSSVERSYPEAAASEVRCADLDGNGVLDLVTVNRDGGEDGRGSVTILFNTKGGIPAEPTHIPVEENDLRPRSIVVVDIDGDLDLDLVTANWLSDSLTLFRNDGAGNFSTESIATAYLPTVVNAADIDGDGDQDLLVANSWFSNTWQASLQIHINNGNRYFTWGVRYTLPMEPRAIAVGDLDLDGDLDLGIACRTADQIALLFNDGLGGYDEMTAIDVGLKPRQLVISDLDDDGDHDIGVAMFMDPNEIGEAWILENLGDKQFQVAQVVAAGYAPHGIAVADIDNDCDQDLVVANVGNQHLTLLVNDGSNLSFTPLAVAMASAAADVSIADIDNDSRPDLIACHPVNNDGVGLVSLRRNATLPCQACSNPDVNVDCNSNGVLDICDIAAGTSQDCNDNHIPDLCDIAQGESADINGNGVPDECESVDCIADLDGNGTVGIGDFSRLLMDWGCTGAQCAADMNKDGTVGIGDFSVLILAFGDVCTTR